MSGGTRIPAEEREPTQSTEGASRRPHTADDNAEREGDVHGLCQFVDHNDDFDVLEDPIMPSCLLMMVLNRGLPMEPALVSLG